MAEVLIVQENMRKEIIEGLSRSPKTLSSKYFYDEKGSELFDQITELKEYYPTRTERKILKKNIAEISSILGDKVILIEPGSGSSEKTKILLENLSSIECYMPIDISGNYLKKIAEELQSDYPTVDIQPLIADYTKPFSLPECKAEGRKVVFFPGSTIGNFNRTMVNDFLSGISGTVGENGALLIGVDLKKDPSVLEAAYNDKKGITAKFNKNILTHLNRKIGSNFDPGLFTHKAVWREDQSRIEMRLYSRVDQTVQVESEEFFIAEGEYIHTENSHKYSLEHFARMVAPWFDVKKVWTDKKNYFSLQYLEPN